MCFIHSLFGNFNLLRPRWQSRHHSNDESRDRIVVFWNPTSLSKKIFSSTIWGNDDVHVREDSDVSLKHTIRLRHVFCMCRTIKMLVSNWPRKLKFSQFLQAGKTWTVVFDLSHQGHSLVTLYVQFLCSDWSRKPLRLKTNFWTVYR